MTSMGRFLGSFGGALKWTLPYLLAGFLAPVVFRNMNSPRSAGRVAGFFFVLAALWALTLARVHGGRLKLRFYFATLLALNLLFWSWRYFNDVPMRQSVLLGLSGGAWHGGLTSLYLLGAILLFGQEFRRQELIR